MHLFHHGQRPVLRLTHDDRAREHRRVEPEKVLDDVVEQEGFTILAVENVEEMSKHDHVLKASGEIEQPLRGIPEKLETFSQGLDHPRHKQEAQGITGQ